MRQRPEQPQEYFLRHVLKPFSFARQPGQHPEYHRFVLFKQLREFFQACQTASRDNCFTFPPAD